MGRPQEFERDKVLGKAMELFWEKGYGATSMADLVEAMNLRPGSIYGAFGSKGGLLMAVIDAYGEESLEAIRDALSKAGGLEKGLDGLFRKMIAEMVAEDRPKGCLLMNVLLELSTIDDAAGERVRGYLFAMQDVLKEALKEAQKTGGLSPGKKIHEVAVFLMGTIYSLRVMGRARSTKRDLDSVRRQALEHAFS